MKRMIKYLFAGVALLLTAANLHAQTFFSIGNGASLYIQQGATVSFDSLVLSPSADVLMTSTDITKSTEFIHTATGTHINRVYQFSQPVAGFSGSIDFGYTDDELNGINENTLVLNVYTGGTWAAFGNGISRDATANYITTPGLTNISFDELTLTSSNGVLPLQWIAVTATRSNSLSYVNWITAQEVNCKYYQVQKSSDTRNWQNIGNPVAARNSANGFNNYSLTNAAFLDSTAYYRIVMTDVSGRKSYSIIVSVRNVAQNLVTVYPNPATDIINVRASGNAVIKQVKVFDASGKLLMIKEGSNNNIYSFNISALANGFYMMAIETNNGKLSKGFMK